MRQMRSEHGQATVLFAISAVALLSMGALSLDAGRAYVLVQQLKTAADAAALAGGQDLPSNPVQASVDAQATAAANGVQSADVTVSVGQSNQTITVTTTGTVPYYFAPLFGVDSGTFSQTSVVEVGPQSQLQGAVPLGVFEQPFVYGQTYTLKAGAGGGGCGNYMALDLNGSSDGNGDNGASQYETNLEDGYPQTMTIGDGVPTETGDMVGPTDTGLKTRQSSDPNSNYQTVLPTSPRVLYLPIISPSDCGKSSVTILGFAAFYLQSVNGGDVTGQFMHLVVDGQFGSSAGDYGLEAERLIQ
ncbi:MAG: pilus assembly protein TadG-related protein [Thermaerobacter sp.]|nr:pilus assembly protein TadG-related protein [Thermaerobacter sp.]